MNKIIVIKFQPLASIVQNVILRQTDIPLHAMEVRLGVQVNDCC